jgi:hypothetical protein
MSTYEFDKVLSEYANGRMPVEMAMGHSLQHIEKLYATQTEAKASRLAQQRQIDALEKRVSLLQAAVERQSALLAKVRRKPKPPTTASQPTPDSA